MKGMTYMAEEDGVVGIWLMKIERWDGVTA